MKFFIAQKVTGEDMSKLLGEMKNIGQSLKEANHTYYCTLYEDKSFQEKSKLEMIKHAFEEIDKSDSLLLIVRSEGKSEGLLMEVGYCLGKNKEIILLIHENIKDTSLREVADQIIEFKDNEDMLNKLKEIK